MENTHLHYSNQYWFAPKIILSSVLFILYTNELIPKHDNWYMIKYADNTTIIGFITNNNKEKLIMSSNGEINDNLNCKFKENQGTGEKLQMCLF